MAIYKRDIASINLETGTIHRTFLNHSIGLKDQKADHFGIRVFRDGEPVDLTGVSVQGVFMPPQGDPIAITSGNIVSGNEAEVVLPQACYNYDGQFTLSIKLVDATNAVTGTMRIVDGMVDNTHASGTVAPTDAVPTYQEILAVYAQLLEDVTDYESVVATQDAKIDDLKSALDSIASSDTTTTGDELGTWQSGKTVSNSGTIGNSSSYSACATFFDIPKYATRVKVIAGTKGIVIGKYSAANESSFIERVFKDASSTTELDLTTVKAIRLAVGSLTTTDSSTVTIQIDYNLRHMSDNNIYRDSYTYGTEKLAFTISGTTIKVSPDHIINWVKTADSTIKQVIIDNEGTEISVPHDSFLIYNFDTSALQVKARTELRDNITGNYTVLFYNNNGKVKGLFEKYSIENRLAANADLFFYGQETYPTFSVDGSYNITVSIPANARANMAIIDGDSPTMKGGDVPGISAQDVTVPHNSCLVYNASTKTLSVKDNSFAYNKDETILFYNSHGVPNGTWYRYYLLQKIMYDRGTEYPIYYNTHVDAKTKQINEQIAGMSSGDAFVFITDIHYNKNSMNSPGLVHDICNKTGITSIHVNGDQITSESNKKTALMQINRINSMYRFAGMETFLTVGNHEWNNPSASDTEEALAKQVNENEMRFAFVNPMRNYVTFADNSIAYYHDNPVAQIRYLVGQVQRGAGINIDSIKWIAEKIAEAPNGYGIVVMIHTFVGFTESGGVYTPSIVSTTAGSFLEHILDAVRAGSSYTFQNVTYDYTGKNLEMIAAFCGHTHVDLFTRTTGGVPAICTTTDSTDEHSGSSLDRTVGTINEQAFDVVVIDREHKKIYCNRIGAGDDRQFDFVE